jgi:hypothetical protein
MTEQTEITEQTKALIGTFVYSVISVCSVISCLCLLVLSIAAMQTKHLPAGWTIGAPMQEYEAGIDNAITHGGAASVYVKQLKPSRGMASLGQTFRADDYRGKRVRFSGYIKTDAVKVSGLWMRIDSDTEFAVASDSMMSRPISGTRDWEKHEVVLEVPENSMAISIGLNLMGSGQAWIDDLSFEVVGPNVSVTSRTSARARLSDAQRTRYSSQIQSAPGAPYNLDFERQGH